MRVFIVLTLVALTVGGMCYTTQDDKLDVDKIMQDTALVKHFLECYLDRAPCDPLAQSYKDIIAISLDSACDVCTDHQKHLWKRFLWNLDNRYPEYSRAFKNKYDPKNVFFPALQKAIDAY